MWPNRWAGPRRPCPIEIVTGDTKVVEKGSGDGLFLNTTGIGLVPEGVRLSPALVRPGDRVLLSGPIGDHGIAILAEREGIQFSTDLASDCAAFAWPGGGHAGRRRSTFAPCAIPPAADCPAR